MGNPFSILIENFGFGKISQPFAIMVKDMLAINIAYLYPVAHDMSFYDLDHD
jgi:hypothetical protein